MVKAIIFDVDDTLVYYGRIGIKLHQDVARKQGLRVPKDSEIAALWGMSWDDIILNLWPDISDMDAFKKKYFESAKGIKTEVIPGTSRAISQLKSKYILGILTGRSKKVAVGSFEELDLDFSAFSFVYTAEDSEYHKPDPRVFTKLIKELNDIGIRKKDVLYVGDSFLDLQAALGAGLNFLGVLTGVISKKEFLAHGVNAIDSVKDLPSYLEL